MQGLVSIEAERYHSSTPRGVHAWAPVLTPGQSGTGSLKASPNIGVSNIADFTAKSPRLDFNVQFVHTGTHYVWIRGLGVTGQDDSLHVGLDGVNIATSDQIVGFGASWDWSQSTKDNTVAMIDVQTTGLHTVNLWMREDGMVVDKLVLTPDASYVPAGEGPAESGNGNSWQVAIPAISPSDGTYGDGVAVTIQTETDGAVLYYTLDGTEPTSGSTPYTAPITLTNSATVKSAAFLGGYSDSEVATAYLTVKDLERTDGGGPFVQSTRAQGLVSIEAENYHVTTPQGAHAWESVSVPAYSGTAALQALPNTGASNSITYSAKSPRLDFSVHFVRTGTHYVWLRGMAASDHDDSVHVGLDGEELVSSEHIAGFGPGWGWSRYTNNGGVATLNVARPGVHTVNLWMREDGMVVDKLVLTTDPTFTPSEYGPVESDRQAVNQGADQAAPSVTLYYEPTDAIFPNPERGFHKTVDIVNERNVSWVYDQGYTLARSYVRLDDYRNSAIPDWFLDSIREGLNAARAAGIKVIPRFVYNFGFEADAPLPRVLQHIDQLQTIFAEYEDVLAFLQAGFIGAWGEWHSSTNDLNTLTNRQAIVNALLNALPSSRMIQLRYPWDKDEMFEAPLAMGEGFTGREKARIGHHNDCFLSRDNDAGTYPEGEIEKYKTYVEKDSRYTPMGGETCNASPDKHRTGCTETLEEMRRFHWTYINTDFYAPAISRWRSEGCFDTIDRRLGYRLRIDEADVPPQVKPGGQVLLRLTLHNEGWSSVLNPRSVYVVLDGATRYQVALNEIDPRLWAPDRDASFAVLLQLPADITAGDYKLALWMPDSSERLQLRQEYSIRFANEGVWNADAGYNELAKVNVDPNAPGTQNPLANQFEVLSTW